MQYVLFPELMIYDSAYGPIELTKATIDHIFLGALTAKRLMGGNPEWDYSVTLATGQVIRLSADVLMHVAEEINERI